MSAANLECGSLLPLLAQPAARFRLRNSCRHCARETLPRRQIFWPGNPCRAGWLQEGNYIHRYIRTAVNHSGRQFVDGDAHTNGIESFWALFKRGYHGVYHQMSKKHLQRYADECAYRLNRKGQSMKDASASVVQGTTDGKQLP